MKNRETKRIGYTLLTAALFGTEILIGLYGRGWIRSYGGDVLVVILLWGLVRSFTERLRYGLPAGIFLFACLVEWLQSIDLCGRLGIDKHSLLAVIIGTSFSWYDILAYAAGIGAVYAWIAAAGYCTKIQTDNTLTGIEEEASC